MNLHPHRGMWWPIVCPPYVVLCIHTEGIESLDRCVACFRNQHILSGTQVSRGTLFDQFTRVYPIFSPDPRY